MAHAALRPSGLRDGGSWGPRFSGGSLVGARDQTGFPPGCSVDSPLEGMEDERGGGRTTAATWAGPEGGLCGGGDGEREGLEAGWHAGGVCRTVSLLRVTCHRRQDGGHTPTPEASLRPACPSPRARGLPGTRRAPLRGPVARGSLRTEPCAAPSVPSDFLHSARVLGLVVAGVSVCSFLSPSGLPFCG